MKLAPPSPEFEYALIIDDVDHDEPSIEYFKTREEAEAAARDEYSDGGDETYPDTTEPGGNTYDEHETPNAVVLIVHVLGRSIL